jgi:tRNA A37 threonylcarbamoyladenosine synthetase subunit TsaC/SUA5/YrdC
MNGQEIIEMARQAGGKGLHLCTDPTETTIAIRLDFEQLEAFAKLVAAKEREACARIAENKGPCEFTAQNCAEEIRART